VPELVPFPYRTASRRHRTSSFVLRPFRCVCLARFCRSALYHARVRAVLCRMAPRRAVSRRLLPHGRRRAVSRAALLHRAALACPYRAVPASRRIRVMPRSCRTLSFSALPFRARTCPLCPALPRLSFPASACLTALRPPCHPALFGARRAEPHRAVSLAGAFRRALPPCRSWPAVVCPHCHAVSRERGPGAAPPMPFRRHSALTRRPAAAWSVQIVCIVAPYARAPRRVHVPQLARAAISPSQLISLSSRTRCRPRIATPPRGPSRADQAPAAHPLTPSNPNIPYGLGGGSGMRYFVSHGETRADFSRRFGAWSRTSGI
jgi:hypothetical protein